MTGTLAQENLEGGIVRVAPQGRLDTFTVPPFEQILNENLDSDRAQLVVDLTEVSYVSSSGLRALLSARRRARAAGGDVVLCGMAPRVREIFEMVGFVSLFNICSSVQDAAKLLATGESARS